ncbi:DUF6265 family protein [Phenylobacterium sp. J367]|uniref:DUF6265 family protein n=1 Tax=Phenylobacterium sp. J367 TaxID=2898435 RepID=UPI002151CCFC|nr:DUF6265 family protein [Phenylobacterium sp. J367]MCR5877865.1 DUF6265 family protein [Phenylobacterium sp. J367]
MRQALATLMAAAALLIAAPALAEPEVRTLPDGAKPPPATIADVAWLTGSWVGEGLGGTAEETYAAPVGGQMVGHFRSAKAGQPAFYEFILLRERDGSLVYGVKHINPDGTMWEEKDGWTEFPLVAVEAGHAFFNGLTFERDGPDRLNVHLRLRKRETGERWIETFRFRRSP